LLNIGRLLLLIALLATCDGHWVVLQSVAWTRMFVSFSHSGDVTQAIVKTFDGQHRCELCKSIEQGSANEKKHDVRVVVAKLILFHQISPVVLMRCDRESERHARNFSAGTRTSMPLTPPPRAGLV
jgi:hypothetical protein